MTNLTVGRGAGYQFGTISAATAAAAAGDTVTVQAGTYTNDFATVYNSISLIAVGGVVSMVATVAPPNGKALLTDYASVSVNGFAFYGAAVADANGAGIRQGGGDLTVTNCLFQDNQDGILVDGNPDTTVTIRHSEFNHNGAGDGYSHNIYVGAVKAFIADDIYSHDAIVGHEIKSRAAMTSITNSRIQDNATGTASYGIDLPNGGVAIISNNILQKGAAAQNVAIVDYGSEGNVPANSTLTISGNTVVNDVNRGFLLLNRSTVNAAVTNNSVYGFTLALENGPANETGTTVLATRPTLNTAAMTLTGATPVPVPVPTPAPAGSDTLVLNLSEDAYLGDAQAVITIDGVVQGGPRTITALKGLGQGQDVSITGSFGNSTHVVSVSFINDAYGGTALTDRNLYLNSIKLNGSTVAGASKTFMANGGADFSFGAASPTPTPVPVPVPVPTPAPTPTPSPITYALEGPKWSPGPITWAFENNNLPSDTSYPFSNPIGTYQSTVLAAFTKWGSVASIPLQQVADTSSLLTAPDIRIGFSKLNTGGTGTIGLTSYRYSTGAVSVFANDTMVRLEDPSELAVTAAGGYSGTGATLYQVALHEIGHALGLAHSSDPNSVMYGVVSGSNQDLNAGDIAGMQAIYGTTPVKVAATTTTSPAATIDVSGLGQQQLADVTSSLLAPLSSAAMPLTVASAPAPLLYNIDATQTILLPLAA